MLADDLLEERWERKKNVVWIYNLMSGGKCSTLKSQPSAYRCVLYGAHYLHPKWNTDPAACSAAGGKCYPRNVHASSRKLLQLDWLWITNTRKINFPRNRKGYDNSETTIGNLSARRIQICRVYFSVILFWGLFFKHVKTGSQLK